MFKVGQRRNDARDCFGKQATCGCSAKDSITKDCKIGSSGPLLKQMKGALCQLGFFSRMRTERPRRRIPLAGLSWVTWPAEMAITAEDPYTEIS